MPDRPAYSQGSLLSKDASGGGRICGDETESFSWIDESITWMTCLSDVTDSKFVMSLSPQA